MVLPAELRRMGRILPGQKFEVERLDRGEYRLVQRCRQNDGVIDGLPTLAPGKSNSRNARRTPSRAKKSFWGLGWIQYLARDYQGVLATAEWILKANRHLVPAIYLGALACARPPGSRQRGFFERSLPEFLRRALRSEALRLAKRRRPRRRRRNRQQDGGAVFSPAF
jgi:hypothetical protein